MDLPYEILVKILSYLPNCDILRRVAGVSRNLYQISQDQHLLRRIEFEFKDEMISVAPNWSEDRKEKYRNDFLEVVKKSRNLKCLSVKMKSDGYDWLDKELFPILRQMFDDLSSIENQCLEEFCLAPKSFTWINHFIENVFGYLDKCPKLKIIKLDKIKLYERLITGNKCRILKELKKSKLKTLEEFHLTVSGTLEIGSLKALLEIISEKPNVKRIFLTLGYLKLKTEVSQVCQEFGLKKKVKIRVMYPGGDSV